MWQLGSHFPSHATYPHDVGSSSPGRSCNSREGRFHQVMSALALHYSLVVVSCSHEIPKSLTVAAPSRHDELKMVNGVQNTMDMDLLVATWE